MGHLADQLLAERGARLVIASFPTLRHGAWRRGLGHALLIAMALAWMGELARAQERPRLVLSLDARRAFVGQAIKGRLNWSGESAPTFEPPEIDWGRIHLGAAERSTTETGWTYRVTILAERQGSQRVPSIVARDAAANLTVRSAPAGIEVRALPTTARPASFRGSVGQVEIQASVEPARIRLGERANLTLVLTGPGALGTSEPPPTAVGPARVGLDLTRTRATTTFDPPARRFTIPIEPGATGRSRIGPWTLSWFDPASGRFVATAAPAISIEVEAVEQLDPSHVVLNGPAPRTQPSGVKVQQLALGLAIAALAGWVLWQMSRRTRRRRPLDARRVAAEWASQLPKVSDSRVAAEGERAIAAYLEAAIQRPRGALTPIEAQSGLEIATHEPGIAQRAREWLEAAHAVRFGASTDPHALRWLRDEAEDLLRGLAALERCVDQDPKAG